MVSKTKLKENMLYFYGLFKCNQKQAYKCHLVMMMLIFPNKPNICTISINKLNKFKLYSNCIFKI